MDESKFKDGRVHRRDKGMKELTEYRLFYYLVKFCDK